LPLKNVQRPIHVTMRIGTLSSNDRENSDKSNPNPNPNPTTKQHAVVSIQL